MLLQIFLCKHKNKIYWMEIIFWCGIKCLGLEQNIYQFLVSPKKFRTSQKVAIKIIPQIDLEIVHKIKKIAFLLYDRYLYRIKDNFFGCNFDNNFVTILVTVLWSMFGTTNSKSEPTLKLSMLWLVFIQKTVSVGIVPKFIPKIDLEIVPKIQKMT